jgi:hypothetical protein
MNRKPYLDRNAGAIKTLAMAAGISVAGALAPSMAMAQSCTGTGNLVVNGGFETGTFANWTVAWPPDADPFTTVSPSNPESGNFAARMGPVPGENSLSQVINGTTAGSVYTLCFWLEHDSNSASAANSFVVRWDGLPVFTLVNSLGFDYTLYEFTVRATGSDTLRFDFQEVPAFWNLDTVGVFPGGPTPFLVQSGAPTKR